MIEMAKFPQSFIDDLRERADIVRIISDYVPLKKRGANWMACCPFHQEKTPSFSVSPAKNIFYCFGCGKGGSVFHFIMEIERVSFPEAVRIVAEKTGVPLPAMEDGRRDQERRHERERLLALNALALEWWEDQLQRTPEALRYLAHRGITEATRRAFRLGFAPDRWDGLVAHLKSRGATSEELERSGLAVKRETGGIYDRFRGRLIFPVLDLRGQPVAFGGRAIAPDVEPKYLNSPETPLYIKGRHLFGLNLTREAIRQRGFAILVEGYLDLIALYQAGVQNAAASLGTALTSEQAKLLGRFARKCVINYDGDRAGREAARRAIEILLAEGFEVKVLLLPDNADPDEFIKSFGVEEYNRRRGAALSHLQFVLEEATRGRDLNRAEDKAAAVEETLASLRTVRNSLLRREYFDQAMDGLRVEDTLRKELWRAMSSGARLEREAVRRQLESARRPPATLAERRLIELLLGDEEVRKAVLPRIEPEDYQGLPTAGVLRALCALFEQGLPIDALTLADRTADDEVAAEIVPLAAMGAGERAPDEAADALIAEAEGCLIALRRMNLERRIKDLKGEIARAERAGRHEDVSRLTEEYVALQRRLNRLCVAAARDFAE
ncbi:MAG: DNA primase [Pyrinomonas sp.]